jgi:hypothetical protein
VEQTWRKKLEKNISFSLTDMCVYVKSASRLAKIYIAAPSVVIKRRSFGKS